MSDDYERKSQGEFQLSASVTGFDTKNDIIFFNIELYSYLTGKEWTVAHRFNDFSELHLILSKFFFKIPPLPNKSIGTMNNLFELKKRQDALDEFIKTIIKRADLISCIYIVKFLKLENHCPDVNLFQPLMLYNLEDLPFPVSKFSYTKAGNLLFVGLTNPSLNGKLNSLFSKIKLLSSSGNKDNVGGVLLVYNIIKNHSGASHFELLYEKELISGVSSINFFESKNILLVGLNNGNINTYKVFINESNSMTHDLVEEVGVIKAHKQNVLGACVNFTLGYVYSVARETKLKISELNYQSVMKEVKLTKKDISAMVYDEHWERIIISEDSGSIWIVDIATNPLEPKVIQALHNQINSMTCLQLEYEQGILLTGSKGGVVCMYQLENYKDKVVPQSFLPNNSKILIQKKGEIVIEKGLTVTSIKLTKKKEILVQLSNGSLAIYVLNDHTNAEFVLDAHLESAVSMYWDEERKMIITGSADKTIKMYQFPVFWPAEMMRKKSDFNRIKPYDEKQNECDKSETEEIIYNDDCKEKEVKVLTENEIFCADLDGWNDDNDDKRELQKL